MQPLDFKVAQTLMRLRLVEHALHSRGTWTMRYAGVEVPASRFIRADRVSIVSHFPPLCPVADPVLSITLHCDGEMIGSTPLEAPLDEAGCQVWWDLVLPDPVSV